MKEGVKAINLIFALFYIFKSHHYLNIHVLLSGCKGDKRRVTHRRTLDKQASSSDVHCTGRTGQL